MFSYDAEMDGHRGLKNERVNEHSAGDYQLVLSALEEDDRAFTFVMHATSSTFSFSGLQPLDLLLRLGYRRYQGNCQFHGERCLWRPMT